MRLVCVIDHGDIAAPKFLLCRVKAFASYQDELLRAFARFHFVLNADMESYILAGRSGARRRYCTTVTGVPTGTRL